VKDNKGRRFRAAALLVTLDRQFFARAIAAAVPYSASAVLVQSARGRHLEFDRFTDEALMVLWFTRQGVGETGGEPISPDHALIGLLRFQPTLVQRFLDPNDPPAQLTSRPCR